MQSFIGEVVKELLDKQDDISHIVFVLPSKRAGTFLKNSIATTVNKTAFAPVIYSIETFVEKISSLTYATPTEQLFTLYESYLVTTKEGTKDSFLTFSKWGSTILQDFNEIDRYLVNPDSIYSHLSAIKELESSLEAEKTEMMDNYIQFWNNMGALYHHFNQSLAKRNRATQGYAYRIANSNIKGYIDQNKNKKFVFLGFNALNKAEENILQAFLKLPESEIYWDIDRYFLNDPIHDASYFMRQHKKNWIYFSNHTFKGVCSSYVAPKVIKIIGVPKNVSQAKYVGNLLQNLNNENPDLLKHTAIVLGDENLLNPIINSIPKEIDRINITMGHPVNRTPVAGMFSLLFDVALSKETKGWFYKEVLKLLSHPYIRYYLDADEENFAAFLADKIRSRNYIYITHQQLLAIAPHQKKVLETLFSDLPLTPKLFLTNCLAIISNLKHKFQASENNLELEYLFRFHTIFNQIYTLVQEHPFITDIKSLQSLYKELISSETLNFQGEPLQGTQIMGMLESRNLDFETVIITSVNEGILPSGKSNNSFIPFDLKKMYGIPTYKEKDAVYTYHFYRLLQRAKNVFLIYNTEPNVLEGNEKSRLITQLLTDDIIAKNIVEIIASAPVKPSAKVISAISKDAKLLGQIKKLATKGFSPTSLTDYIRNPIDFYKKNILKINDTNEVEENVAANTFGTIVHDSLEHLYQPFIGKYLERHLLENLIPKIEETVKNNFVKTYGDGDITHGKNLIAYHVILRYIENFIRLEIKEIAQHQIKIVALEQNMEAFLEVPSFENSIKIRGKLDRIDEFDGTTRIIDYKTGKVEMRNVKINNYDELLSNYDKSKAFQLLCYALLFDAKQPISAITAGIISFKNLSSGFLNFHTANGEVITPNTILEFKSTLMQLILEIGNPDIPFTDKEL